ncbi:acyltransferase [Listeria kieliensis]|uniref:Galactoside O-acetyltransferase n=1 Tax=Listeria kieliensis TaxID=1621700 RepID=A0A3D8TQB6_9LIST|nr:acyltransferase [Listeria kieliensis]RDX00843.1 galactoside O-acetyltransferase [Listeria kieliensis]
MTKWLFALLNLLPMPSKHPMGLILRKLKNRLAKRFFGGCAETSNLRPFLKLRHPQHIFIGKESSIGDKTKIVASARVSIGDYVLMAPEVIILTENHRIDGKKQILFSGTEKKEVRIGNDVWIGTRAIILPGASIPEGCVVAAGAVVPAKEYPAYAVIGGIPAQVIKMRQ